MSRGFISLHAKPHKTHVYWPGGYEALGFARATTPRCLDLLEAL